MKNYPSSKPQTPADVVPIWRGYALRAHKGDPQFHKLYDPLSRAGKDIVDCAVFMMDEGHDEAVDLIMASMEAR